MPAGMRYSGIATTPLLAVPCLAVKHTSLEIDRLKIGGTGHSEMAKLTTSHTAPGAGQLTWRRAASLAGSLPNLSPVALA